jgi:tRNA-dihydrouridine synthase A
MVGHSGGAALMRDPDLVARCVDAMHKGVASVADYYVGTSSSDHRPRMRPTISVKHRLGVRDAATFDGAADRMKNDEDSYEECRSFVETVALSGAVTKFHVHGRLGLLGEFSPQDKTTKSKRQEQERSARQQTIKNRDVPPLRPDVVQRLAYEFPHLEFVANGGIQTLSDVDRLVNVNTAGSNKSRVVGAMVGRAAINHPCAFASADRLWEKQATTIRRPTRGEVLQEYIEYCDREEDRIVAFGASKKMVDELRRRLVAAPFHLTMGEDGNEAFQRRVKKLTSKTVMLKASSILSGAASFLPASTLGKCVDDFVPWEDIAQYEDSCRRSGAMQRMIS